MASITYVVKNASSTSLLGLPGLGTLDLSAQKSYTLVVGSYEETNLLSLVGNGSLIQTSATPVFVAMSGYSQSFLPVMTDDGRIIGTVTLDAPTAFVGNETTKTVSTKSVPVRRFRGLRTSDGVAFDFMVASVTAAQERDGYQTRLPNYIEIGTTIAMDIWMATGGNVTPANRSSSPIQTFLSRTDF